MHFRLSLHITTILSVSCAWRIFISVLRFRNHDIQLNSVLLFLKQRTLSNLNTSSKECFNSTIYSGSCFPFLFMCTLLLPQTSRIYPEIMSKMFKHWFYKILKVLTNLRNRHINFYICFTFFYLCDLFIRRWNKMQLTIYQQGFQRIWNK